MTHDKNTHSEIRRGRVGFLWFAIIAFSLMLAVWLALFIVASNNKVQEIPLAPAERAAELPSV